ncbi:MAG: tyrosine-type recombinase/integrase [Planctomycetota bacterium]
MKGLTPHGLRYTFCTRLMSKGCDPASVRDVMGHSSFKMLSKYSCASSQSKRDAVNKLDRGKQWTHFGHFEDKSECIQKETVI